MDLPRLARESGFPSCRRAGRLRYPGPADFMRPCRMLPGAIQAFDGTKQNRKATRMISRNVDSIQRRQFIQAASGLGALGFMSGLGDLVVEAAARKIPPDLQAARDQIMADLEANLGMSVPRVDGQFLNLLIHATQAKKALEIGTFKGYSATWMALGLEETDGKLITVEIDPERVKDVRARFEKAGFANRITAIEGDGHEVAKTIEGPFDLVFLDAEKGKEVDYFNKLFPKLRPGGFIVLHNAIQFKDQMKAYLDLVQKHPQLISVVLSLSMKDGMSVSLRKRD
jgi:caffeoyl-CoA O-methyltransferase